MPTELTPSLRFRRDGFAGYITGGHEHGVHLTEGADGLPITRPMCLNVEHYYATNARGGRFVPRYKAAVHTDLTGDALRLRIEPFEAWRVSVDATYRFV